MKWLLLSVGLVAPGLSYAQGGMESAPLDPANRMKFGAPKKGLDPAIAGIPTEIFGQSRSTTADNSPTGFGQTISSLPAVGEKSIRLLNQSLQRVNVSWWDTTAKIWKTVAIAPFQSEVVQCVPCQGEIRIAFHDGEKSTQYLAKFGVSLPITRDQVSKKLWLGANDVSALKLAPDE